MAQKKLQLMISSRSDKGGIKRRDGTKMSLRDVRLALKDEIEGAHFLGVQLIEVWINETEIGDGDGTAWEECLDRARACDLFLSLYSGSPGWTEPGGGIGICHAEFDAAFGSAPGKVRVIRMPDAKVSTTDDPAMAFLKALDKARRFEVRVETDFEDLLVATRRVVRELLLKVTHEGVRQNRRSAGSLGLALDWSRLNFEQRSAAIQAEIGGELQSSARSHSMSGETLATRDFKSGTVLFACHGAARSLSMAAAREILGRPFLRDHLIVKSLTTPDVCGPVHLIGVPAGTTENQAEALLGTPDVFTVKASFGVYAVDRLNKIQVCLLADCEDPGGTRNSVLRFLEWLDQSGEATAMIERAKARRRIVAAILAEA